jgi:hypothetical protein
MAWYHSNEIIFVLNYDIYTVGVYLHNIFRKHDNFIAFIIGCHILQEEWIPKHW